MSGKVKSILAKFKSIFGPVKIRVGVSSPRGSIYWKKNLSTMCEFILNQDEKTLDIVKTGPFWTKDPFLASREAWGAYCPITAAEVEDEEEEARGEFQSFQLQKLAHQERRQPSQI